MNEAIEILRLEPCPFCSAIATNVHQAGSAWFIDADHASNCLLNEFQRTEAEAITAWNTRASLAQPEREAVSPKDVAVLFRATGSYEDYRDIAIRAYASKEDAGADLATAKSEWHAAWEAYLADEIDDLPDDASEEDWQRWEGLKAERNKRFADRLTIDKRAAPEGAWGSPDEPTYSIGVYELRATRLRPTP